MSARRRVSEKWKAAHLSLKNQVSDGFRRHEYLSPPPNRLFHFTDCGGLLGILQTRTLWASLATSLNDRSEIEYGRTLIDDVIGRRGDISPRISLTGLRSAWDRQTWRVYVVSFCTESNSALQWMHYGRSGSGVAIGFNATALPTQYFELSPVLYDQEQQKAWLRALVETVDGALEVAQASLDTWDDLQLLVDVAIDLLVTNLRMVTPRMKDKVFAVENEWRLITYVPKGIGVPAGDPTGPTCFRTASGRVIPYRKVKYDALPVNEIMLGASCAIKEDRAGLRVLIEDTLGSAEDVTITESSVPLRA